MSLKYYVSKLLELMQVGNQVEHDTYNYYVNIYYLQLNNCTDATEIWNALNEDADYILPVTIRIDTYRKLIEIERTPNNLKYFASYLYLHGPDWDIEAAKLLKEAEELDTSI